MNHGLEIIEIDELIVLPVTVSAKRQSEVKLPADRLEALFPDDSF